MPVGIKSSGSREFSSSFQLKSINKNIMDMLGFPSAGDLDYWSRSVNGTYDYVFRSVSCCDVVSCHERRDRICPPYALVSSCCASKRRGGIRSLSAPCAEEHSRVSARSGAKPVWILPTPRFELPNYEPNHGHDRVACRFGTGRIVWDEH